MATFLFKKKAEFEKTGYTEIDVLPIIFEQN